MRNNKALKIILHVADCPDSAAIKTKINEFHASVVEQRLAQTTLTVEDKIIIINKIIENLKSREINGIIK